MVLLLLLGNVKDEVTSLLSVAAVLAKSVELDDANDTAVPLLMELRDGDRVDELESTVSERG